MQYSGGCACAGVTHRTACRYRARRYPSRRRWSRRNLPSSSLSASSPSLSRFVRQRPPSRIGYYLGHQASRRSRARPPTCACPRNIRNTVAITRHRPGRVVAAALCGNVANPLRSFLRLTISPPFLTRLTVPLLAFSLSLSFSMRVLARD